MTQNQIAYYKAKVDAEHYARMDSEAATHNRATEQEATRHAKATEDIDVEKNRLTAAYNTGTLEHYVRTDSEQARTNRENEFIKRYQNLENVRHDIATEQIDRDKNRLTAELNQVKSQEQKETVRHDKATEDLTRSKQWHEIGKLDAETSRIKSDMILDTVRLDEITSQTLLNLEKTKTEGFNTLLTQEKVRSESALTRLRDEQAENTAYNTGYMSTRETFNALGNLGKLLGGLKGFPVTFTESTGYPSSVTYNAYTGLYE